MKHLCFFLLFAMTAVLYAAAKPAETAKPATTAKPAATATQPGTVLTSIFNTDRDPASFADPEKAENLIKSRAEIVKKLQDERKRILKEDAAAKKLNEEIMLLNRRLASLLESRKSMIELNSQLRELDDAISKLKPAPPPEPETKDTKKEDTGEAGKE
jgi:hypothetical protein